MIIPLVTKAVTVLDSKVDSMNTRVNALNGNCEISNFIQALMIMLISLVSDHIGRCRQFQGKCREYQDWRM